MVKDAAQVAVRADLLLADEVRLRRDGCQKRSAARQDVEKAAYEHAYDDGTGAAAQFLQRGVWQRECGSAV